MKRFVCMLMALVMCLSLCACSLAPEPGAIYDQGFVVISSYDDYNHLVYDINTNVVFYLETGSYRGFLTPYQIYQNGAIYGAVYENGEIVPTPYALGITDEMIENQFNNWFG